MIEFKVRPVSRYSVTRYEKSGKSGSCGTVGEFNSMRAAIDIAEALAKYEGGTHTANILPEQDIPSLLRNIAEYASGMIGVNRGIVVLELENGGVCTFGLGETMGDVEELFEKGLAEYHTPTDLET